MATVDSLRTSQSLHSPGRLADGPSEMASADWRDILWRVYAQFTDDRIILIAAGASFYLLLALFPALAAFVSIYGFVANPDTVAEHIAFLGGVLPSGSIDLIRTQIESLAAQNSAALSFGFVFGLLFALWSANNGIKTIFEALNVAYEEREKRSFLRLNAVAFLFTLGAIVIGMLFIVSVGVVPAVLAFVGMPGSEEALVSILRWPVLLLASAAAISILYRYGPSRERARWQWVTWGGVLAAFLWLVASVLFSWYLTNFADYNATYGSLGAVIGFMLWTWISLVILLLGAELNAEIEHQTARDSTTGDALPMGMRGATMADTLGRSHDGTLPEAASAPFGEADAPEDRPARAAQGIAAVALPLVALGLGLGLGMLDRRRRGWSAPRRGNASRKQPARGGFNIRDLFDRPEVKERLADASQMALKFAQAAAIEQLAKLQRRWR